MSTRSMPMRKTMAPSTALGMSVRPPVRNSRTTRTTTDIVMLATCVLPCWPSRIWVLVGLPLTTKVPLSPAATFAPLSPMRSWLTSTRSPCRDAKLLDVAALWAMMRTKHEKATPARPGMSDQPTPCGRPIGGKPPWTVPMTATPWVDIWNDADTTMDSTTATMAPGTAGANLLKPRISASVPTAKARVGRLVCAEMGQRVPLLLEPVASCPSRCPACRGSVRRRPGCRRR